MATLLCKIISIDEYLDGESRSDVKHEYIGGTVHAMAGATNRHNMIAGNCFAELFGKLRGRSCQPFNSDTKVRIELEAHTRFYYPDAMVVCQSNDPSEHYQDRPVVVLEVLSESTRRVDLSEKLDAYLKIPSLKVLMLIESEEVGVTVYRRRASDCDGGFAKEQYADVNAVISLAEIEASLSLTEIYERVL